MFQYYKITSEINSEIWECLVNKYGSATIFESVEYFGLATEEKQRALVSKNLASAPLLFNTIKADYTTVSMRPFLLKQDSFSLIYSYKFNGDTIDLLWNSKWIGDDGMEYKAFVIKENDQIQFIYSPMITPIILLGNGELQWANKIGLEIEKYNITLNELIG